MISLIHPSRSRPQKAHETATKWLANAGCDIEYIQSLDTSDPYLKEYKTTFLTCINDNKSVVEATNHAAKKAKGNILIYLSDDFDCFENWGAAALKEFAGEDRPLLLKVDDCLQPFEVAVLTIPMMNRKLYETLGYFWYPQYRSMFCDEDLYWTCRKLGAIKNAPHLKFEHQHVSVGKAQDDETYRASSKNWDQGKELFKQRKAAGFPL